MVSATATNVVDLDTETSTEFTLDADAVTWPSGRNTGLSDASFSSVVPARGPSSLLITVPSGSVIGVISRSKNPFSLLCTERSWLRLANASMSARATPSCCTTFSAV